VTLIAGCLQDLMCGISLQNSPLGRKDLLDACERTDLKLVREMGVEGKIEFFSSMHAYDLIKIV
jgi:hypothetical protein